VLQHSDNCVNVTVVTQPYLPTGLNRLSACSCSCCAGVEPPPVLCTEPCTWPPLAAAEARTEHPWLRLCYNRASHGLLVARGLLITANIHYCHDAAGVYTAGVLRHSNMVFILPWKRQCVWSAWETNSVQPEYDLRTVLLQMNERHNTHV
jgi:hypothetical protein